ncbi:MAG: protease [Proteobacteria bacterium]|nr:MAG: protease [Pseudomonadota bacterium]
MKAGAKRFLARTLAGLCFGIISSPGEARAELPAYREGEIIVKYRDGVNRSFHQLKSVYQRLSVVNVQRFESAPFKNFETLSIDTSAITLAQAADELVRDPAVEYVQPNFILTAHREPPSAPALAAEIPAGGPAIDSAPKDPTNLGDPAQKKAWGISKVGADKAWAKQKGSREIIVAVIDSGVDYNHPDLADNMWRNPAASRRLKTGVDGAGSDIAGDIVGWDFVENDNRPYDLSGHGTHCAGTIGAVGGNGKGISGINQRVSIMAVRFLNASGSGATSDGIKAIDYAISRGAKVLSNSWGGKGSLNRALRDAVARSEKAGVLFVASAGNDGTNNDRVPSYPGAFDLPNVIAVAATNSADALVSFSNFGANSVDLGAPGYDIYSTKPGGGYQYLSGTSMAAPHVAGAAALLWAQDPQASYADIKRRLLDSGDPLASLEGKTVSGKRLNVVRALAAE